MYRVIQHNRQQSACQRLSHEILVALVVSLSMFSAGLHVGWTGPAVHILSNSKEAPFNLTPSQTSYLASTMYITGLIGSIIAYHLAAKWSRSKLININALIFFASAIIYTLWQSMYPFFAARILAGIAAGSSYTAAPLYVCEIASPKVRGALVFILHVASASGGVLSYFIVPFTSLTTFSSICIGVSLVHFVCSLALPESPFFLLLKRDQEGARKVLRKLRKRKDVTEELEVLNGLVKEQSKQPRIGFQELMLNEGHRKAVLISCCLIIAQEFSGHLALNTYSIGIFMTAEIPISSDVCGIIYQGIGALALLISGIFIDIFGRRTLLIVSYLTVFIALVTLGGYYFLQYIHLLQEGSFPYIPLTFMVIHISGGAIGLIPLPYIISNELMPTSVRPLGSLIVVAFASVSAAGSTIIFQILDEAIGKFAPLWLFAFLLTTLVIPVLIYLPETKGRTLDEIKMEK